MMMGPPRATDHDETRAAGRFWAAVDAQLRRPSGPRGAVVGTLMLFLNAAPYRRAIDALEPGPDDSVLELGFGTGHGLAALASRTPRGKIAGLDHSPDMMASASRRNRRAIAGGRMTLVQGGFESLPWPPGSFDRVLLVNVIYFFDTGGLAASEVFRVLRPGGRVAVYATDQGSLRRLPFAGPQTHRAFDADGLAQLLGAAGLEARVERFRLPFGIDGLLATASKGPAVASRRGRAFA